MNSKTFSALCAITLLPMACNDAASPVTEPAWADMTLSDLGEMCGKAFEGVVTSTDAADDTFRQSKLVMHVRDCSETEVRIPLHVGNDSSRVWVISKLEERYGLSLKHDHRHDDGSEDVLTQYGGETAEGSSPSNAPLRIDFPADDYSKNLFEREGIPQSMTNVWTVEFVPGTSFAYELNRPNRHFRVAFDLTTPVPTPPPAWDRVGAMK